MKNQMTLTSRYAHHFRSGADIHLTHSFLAHFALVHWLVFFEMGRTKNATPQPKRGGGRKAKPDGNPWDNPPDQDQRSILSFGKPKAVEIVETPLVAGPATDSPEVQIVTNTGASSSVPMTVDESPPKPHDIAQPAEPSEAVNNDEIEVVAVALTSIPVDDAQTQIHPSSFEAAVMQPPSLSDGPALADTVGQQPPSACEGEFSAEAGKDSGHAGYTFDTAMHALSGATIDQCVSFMQSLELPVFSSLIKEAKNHPSFNDWVIVSGSSRTVFDDSPEDRSHLQRMLQWCASTMPTGDVQMIKKARAIGKILSQGQCLQDHVRQP